MPFPPVRTWAATVTSSGFSSSRFGPTWPFAFAALSVWQPPQPAVLKTCAPGSFASAAFCEPAPPPPLLPQPAAITTIASRTPPERMRNFIDPVHGYDSAMVATSPPALEVERLRADFPIFEQSIHGKPLAYLDSAVTAQKPRQVLDKMTNFYETSYANVHRGVYTLSERATAEFERARELVASFVNAPSSREVIFTRQATEALNLVAYSWGLNNLGPGDLVVVTELEHHSNFVPWQYMAKRTGAGFRMIHVERRRRARPRRPRGDRGRGQRQGRREQPGLERARHDQPRREARGVGPRAGRDPGRRRRPGGTAPPGRRPGARL